MNNIKWYNTRVVQYDDIQFIDESSRRFMHRKKGYSDRINLLSVPLLDGYLVNLENLFKLNLQPDSIAEWITELPEHISRQIHYLSSVNQTIFTLGNIHDNVYTSITKVRKSIEDKYMGDAPLVFEPLKSPNDNDFVPNPNDLGTEFISCRIVNIVHIAKDDMGRDWVRDKHEHAVDMIDQHDHDAMIANEHDIHLLFLEKYREDGTFASEVKVIVDGERPVYIVKPDKRNYVQKRIAEPLENLIELRTTESDKWRTTYEALCPNVDTTDMTTYDCMREVRLSPYTYGVESTFTNFCNYYYPKQFSHTHALSSTYAYFDFEADIHTKVPSVASIVMRDPYTKKVMVKLFINEQSMPDVLTGPKKFLSKVIKEYDMNPSEYPDLEMLSDIKTGKPIDMLYKNPNIIKSEKLDVTLYPCKNDMEVVAKLFGVAHKWKPNFLTAWNIAYDLSVCIDTCQRYGFRFEDIVSTPGIPEALRYFHINPGNAEFESASGKSSTRDNHEVWSSFPSTSFFYLIDHMKAHFQLRKGEKVVNTGYSLEAIVNHTFGDGVGKMTIPEEDRLRLESVTPAEKHAYLAKHRQAFYSAYNISDNIAGLCLLEKSEDFKTKFRALCEVTSFNDFGASTKAVMDPLSMYMLDIDHAVIGTNIQADATEEVKLFTGDVTRNGVTIVLKSTYSDNNNGTNGHILVEDGSHFKNVGTTISDGDVVSSYPSCGIALSASKAAACRELYIIHARNPQRVRKLMTSLTVGGSFELCVNGLNLPAPLKVLEKARVKLIKRNEIFVDGFNYLGDTTQRKPDGLLGGDIYNDKLSILDKDNQAMLDLGITK